MKFLLLAWSDLVKKHKTLRGINYKLKFSPCNKISSKQKREKEKATLELNGYAPESKYVASQKSKAIAQVYALVHIIPKRQKPWLTKTQYFSAWLN